MKTLPLLLLSLLPLFLASCVTPVAPEPQVRVPYDSLAYRAKNPAAVKVKVSLANMAVYVMEGDRPLLVTATTVGAPETPTPRGNFKIYNKTAKRRAYTKGYYMSPDKKRVIHSKVNDKPKGWRYIGYPMGYWCEFKYAYGFHSGWVWNVPRSQGCLRLHRNVAPKFFALVRNGTPVNISQTQPEDLTIGKSIPRPTDYNDPEHPGHILLTDKIFEREVNTPLFEG